MSSQPAEIKIEFIKRALSGEKIASLAREAGVSRKTFYKWLQKYQNTPTNLAHLALKDRRSKKLLNFKQLELSDKSSLVEKFDNHISISQISREQGVSRKTIYKWLARFKSNGNEGLKQNRPKADQHYKSLSAKTKQTVLDFVADNPSFSVHELTKKLNFVGHHGIQTILEDYNLSKTTDRLIYASKFGHAPMVDEPIETIDTISLPALDQLSPNVLPGPPPPLTSLPQSRQPHSTSIVFFIISFILAIFLTIFILTLTSANSISEGIGFLFAFLAFGAGSLFFIYSLKYYGTIAYVLLFSRKLGEAKDLSNNPHLLTSLQNRAGVLPDLSQITLTRHPFVSIHLPLYNEKRVVNRLLEAATSIDYDNYEIIVCDDSTDETKEIVSEWKNHPRVKISHRENREGYKGGALKEALKLMDPQTEFILVYDADFIPFPDTINQFLKYFQQSVGSLDTSVYQRSPTAGVQGYQWHVLNKSENWITRGVRTEYAGSYVIERTGTEIYSGLKQLAGSVFMVRRDILSHYEWGSSITEDFELTLKLYRDGYKVVYTPYIQAPSECVSTLKRLIRQRMRWAEGHSFNIKKYFRDLIVSTQTSLTEKLEFMYLSPYYLQSAFFLIGTFCWFVSETIFRVRLPFWTAVWGWSLVLTNLFSLPLMNLVGLFLEQAEEKDYSGILAFILLTYIVAPFQAYASVKGFLEKEEGPWFRTPKTGKITDIYKRGRIYRWLWGIFGQPNVVREALQVTPSKKRLDYVLSQEAMPVKKRSAFVRRTALAFCLIIMLVTQSLLNPGVIQLPPAVSQVFSNDIEVHPSKDSYKFGEQPQFQVSLSNKVLGKTHNSRFLGILGPPNEALATSADKISTRVLYRNQDADLPIQVNSLSVGSYAVQVGTAKNFKPGKYTLETKIEHEGKSYMQKQDFSWGVLAVNTTKDQYLPGETIEFGFGVVDDVGRTICDAQLTMNIVVPSEKKTYELSTNDGTIWPSGKCERQSVTNEADYQASFIARNKAEDYQIHVITKTYNGTSEIEDQLHLVAQTPFNIKRSSFPTRIYPKANYQVALEITPQIDFVGTVTDTMPNSEFMIFSASDGGIYQDQKINWNVKWERGKTYKLEYSLLFPLTSPELYRLGPLTLIEGKSGKEIYRESRSWQVAADALAFQRAASGTANPCNLTTTGAFATNTTATDLIAVTVDVASNTVTASVTDSSGNSYKTAIGPITNTGRGYIFYAENIAGGANTVTVTVSSSIACAFSAAEYSGVATSSSLDQTSSSTGTTGTALDSGSKTTTVANEVIVGGGVTSANHTFTAGTNFTIRGTPTSRSAIEDFIVSSTGSNNATMTINSTSIWTMMMATFADTSVPENWVILTLLSPFVWWGITRIKKRRKKLVRKYKL